MHHAIRITTLALLLALLPLALPGCDGELEEAWVETVEGEADRDPATSDPESVNRWATVTFGIADGRGGGHAVVVLDVGGEFLAVTADHVLANLRRSQGEGPYTVYVWWPTEANPEGVRGEAEGYAAWGGVGGGGVDGFGNYAPPAESEGCGALWLRNLPPEWLGQRVPAGWVSPYLSGSQRTGLHATVVVRDGVPSPFAPGDGGLYLDHDLGEDGEDHYRLTGGAPEPGDSGSGVYYGGSLAGIVSHDAGNATIVQGIERIREAINGALGQQ